MRTKQGKARERDSAVMRALTRLPPMWLWFDFRTPDPCVLSLLLVVVLTPRGFSWVLPGFPLSLKINISRFQFDLESDPNYSMLPSTQPLNYLNSLFGGGASKV